VSHPAPALRYWRLQCAFNQAELARFACVSRTAIQRVEHGSHYPASSAPTLVRQNAPRRAERLRRADSVVKLYLSTTEDEAHRILNRGFVDTELAEFDGVVGVLLADRRLDQNEGRTGDEHLLVEIPDAMIREFEVVAEQAGVGSGFGYREWVIPAAILNASGQVQLIED
jgi:transcriptional regulator with XRE-family HTH domain